MRRVALREPFEAVAKADDFEALVDAFNGGRRDDAVDAGRRAATDQNTQSAFIHMNGGSRCARATPRKNSIPFLP